MVCLRMASPFKHPKTGVYQLRRAVPRDLREILGIREFKKTLGTKDPAEAKRLFPAALQECDEVFARARAGRGAIDRLDAAQLKAIEDAWYAHVLEEDEEERLKGVDDGAYERVQDTLDIVQHALKAELARGIIDDGTAYEFDDFLRSYGYNIPTSSPEYPKVHFAMLRSWVRALAALQQRHQGEPIETPRAPEIGPQREIVDGTNDPTKLSGAFDGWRAERKPSERVWSEWTLARRRFIETNGDVQLARLDRGHVRKFKDALIALGLSQASIKKHLSAIRSVLAWAFENGLVQHNVVAGVRVRDAKVQPEARLPYSAGDLELLFSSPIYTAGKRPRAGGGEAAFWLPLMALFLGCRLEEMGQAFVSDIVTMDGVLCLDINDRGGGKSVKAVSSRRLVPIHPELLRLGFAQYTASLPSDGRLFPQLKPDRFGKRTGNFSKWFGRWARDLGVEDRRKVFHSFRHTFKLACRRAGIEEEIHDLLTGHRGSGVGRSYGRGGEYGGQLIKVLADAIAKVQYTADLSAVPAWSSGDTHVPERAAAA